MTKNNSQTHPIFIIDDEEQQAHLMQEMAKAADLETQIFTSSVEFLEQIITSQDIIILDLHIPDKDGIEVMRELANRNIYPFFILVSGFDERILHSAKQLAEAKQMNVVATLSKPFKAKKFIQQLKQTYEKCQSQQTPPINTHAISIDELKQAIRRHEFVIHYQPQIHIKTSQLAGAEVLLYWQHSHLGLIPPHDFIPLAEKHHLMNLLTEEMLMLMIKDYQKLTASSLDVKLSLNLSAQNIHDLAMPEKLEALIKSNHLNPASFSLEITESALINDTSESLDILNRLRMKGFLLSINNFGAGYSSLVTLYQAPFNELKINQDFIQRIATDNEAKAIVKICILLAKELNMQSIAAGINNQPIWRELKHLKCDIAQGNFISKPMEINNFTEWVSRNNKISITNF